MSRNMELEALNKIAELEETVRRLDGEKELAVQQMDKWKIVAAGIRELQGVNGKQSSRESPTAAVKLKKGTMIEVIAGILRRAQGQKQRLYPVPVQRRAH